MRVTIQRSLASRRASFFQRKRLVYLITLGITFSDEEYSAIKQRNLYDLPIMDRPFHPLHGASEEEWDEIQALPVGLLIHLHETQRLMEIAYYHNDFDAGAGERQLRKGLETLKNVIMSSRETNRTDEFEL